MDSTDKTLLIAASIAGIYLVYKASQGASTVANGISQVYTDITQLPQTIATDVLNASQPVLDALGSVGVSISDALFPPASNSANSPTVGQAVGQYFGLRSGTSPLW